MHIRAGFAAAAMILVTGACGDDGPAVAPNDIELEVRLVAEGLDGPTQLFVDDRDRIVVAELNGGERDGTGRVVRIDPERPGGLDVLVTDLLVPTGVALDDDLLWIMEQRRLTVGPYADPSDRTIVLDELPYNGRSEGTLTAVDGGGILYNTSGRTDGDRLTEGSGSLWFLATPDAVPEMVATGFKHAYAHAALDDGRWLVTEVSDGRLNGGPPPDELVIAERGDDFGFPRCIGDGEPVADFGVTDDECASTPPSLALFEPRATPTSVVIAPWDPSTALVALWTLDDIVAVPVDAAPAPHVPRSLGIDVGRPQHLTVDGDRVLVTDHERGSLLALVPRG